MKKLNYRFMLPNWAWVLTVFMILTSTLQPAILGVMLSMWIIEGRFAECTKDDEVKG